MAGRAKFILIALILLFGIDLHAQGIPYQLNPPAPNARVQFCPVPDGGYPCPTLTTVYSDSAATQVINQPISTGSSGNLSVYFAAGTSSVTVQFLGQGYGPQNRFIASLGGGGSGSIATTIDVINFGVKADAKVCFDGTVTISSPNISSAGQCQWTSADIGKKVFATSLCNVSQCGFSNGPTSVTILPSTQTTVARIASVTDATHIVADCNAPGNCVSPNASNNLSNTATVIYGDDDTAALNSAFASWTGTTGCPTFSFPRGLIFWNAALFVTLPNLALNPCTSPGINAAGSSKFQNLGQAIGNGALTFKGQGPFSTLFVPTPDFNFGSCTATLICFGAILSPVYEDFGVWGAGQSLLGAGVASGATLFNCNSCVMQNVSLTQWGSRAATLAGLNFSNGFGYGTNIYTNSFGGGGGGLVVAGDANQITNSTIGFSSNSMSVKGVMSTSNVIFYGPTAFDAPVIDVVGTGTWFSSNDRTEDANLATAATPVVRVENGGLAVINNFGYFAGSNANSAGLSIVAGGTAKVYGWRTSVATLTSGGNIAGTLMGWGNDFGGPLTVTGNVVNAPSEQGNWTCVTGTATITFHSPVTYRSNPVVLLTDNTTAGGARISAENTTTATVTCTGASDVGVYSVTPNPN